jgi:hypothetical protein
MRRHSSKFLQPTEIFSAICGTLLITTSVIPQAVSAQQTTYQQPINQPNSKVNPCPKIFYEAPHNNQAIVPQGCPPNAFTQRLIEQGLLPQSNANTNPTTEQTRLGVGGEAGSALNPNPRIFNEPPYNRSQRRLSTEGSSQPETTQPGVNPSTPTPRNQRLTPRESQLTPPPSQRQRPIARIALANGKVNVRLVNDTVANITYEVIGDTAPRSLSGKSDVILQGLKAPVNITFQRQDGGLLQATPQPGRESGVLELRLKETTDVGQNRSALRIENNGSVFLN